MLLLEAFQYNPEEEKAISNRALAHFLLGEVEEGSALCEKDVGTESSEYRCLCCSR